MLVIEDERAAIRWLHRRAGFGLASSELEAATARGFQAELDALISADAVATAVAADPWDDADLPLERDRAVANGAISSWLDGLVSSSTPGVDRMAWLWHGHLVSGLDKVKIARLMVDQIRLFRSLGLGSFRDLLRSITIDPAMLLYLDGAGSTGESPNENYGREVLELFTIGLGGYEEADVAVGAAAFSGWVVRRGEGRARFSARRHDDTPRRYLGRDGVHDVDTAVDAIMAHPHLAASIGAAAASPLLGTSDEALIVGPVADFAASGFDVQILVRSLLVVGASRPLPPVVLAPVPWLVIAQRVTGAVLGPKDRLRGIRAAGQVPMVPPNVAGWPSGAAWFGSSTIVARARLAAQIALATPAGGAPLVAATGDDADALADALGLPTPFGEASVAALTAATPGPQRLALALCAPEFVLA
jgi:uncharacterized protein (DUF1800 family)